mgnify:FL=1
MKSFLLLLLLLPSIVLSQSIDDGFDSFDGPGEWLSPSQVNTGSHDSQLCFNVVGVYLTSEFYVFQSPIYDFSTWNTVELLWRQDSDVRPGDIFGLYYYDNGWFYFDLSNLNGWYGVTLPTSTIALAFVLNTLGGSGNLNDKFSHVEFLSIYDVVVLPVELLDFSASLQDEGNLIEWSTASENNSLKFDLYKSSNGIDWGMLSEIPAGGFSTSELKYNFLDRDMLPGYSYYKLIQIDIDGEEDVYGPIYTYRNVFSEPRKYNLMGQEVNESYKGLVIDNNGIIKYNE